jgi:ketosteroid isomerase-like protein
MSAETDTVRQFYARCTEGDLPGMLELLHPQITFDPVLGVLYEHSRFEGHEGMSRWFRSLQERWGPMEQIVEETRQTGPDEVVAFVRLIAHDADRSIEARIAVDVRFREGLIVSFIGHDAEETAERLGSAGP